MFEKVSTDEHAMAHSTPRSAETRRRRVGYLEEALHAEAPAVASEAPTASPGVASEVPVAAPLENVEPELVVANGHVKEVAA
jgi:hypothetical protein